MIRKIRFFFPIGVISIVAISWCCINLSKSHKKPKQPYLTVVGPVMMADGIGRQAAELIELLKDDLTVGYKPVSSDTPLEKPPKEISKILKKQNIPMGKVIVYEDHLGADGLSFQRAIKGLKNNESVRIAYSMLESSLIPNEWVVGLNHYFDAVAVPDKFLIDSYKNSGVTIPVFVLPLRLNLEEFLNMPLKKKKNSPMIFANFSSAIPRKNQIRLIQAFHKTFGNSSEVVLKLNSRVKDDPSYAQAIKDEIRNLGVNNIIFTEMCMEKKLYLQIFQGIDCYVSLSSGEGFSIQPREAMALGIPTIITNNTGQSTICKSHLGRVVPSLNTIPAFYPMLKNYYGVFYDCKTEDVVQALKDVYNNYEYYLQQGSAARAWVQQASDEHLKPYYLGLIKPKKIVLGTINEITPDCLFTDSEELCNKFNKIAGIPFEDQRTTTSNCNHIWK